MDRHFRKQPESVCDAVEVGQVGTLPHVTPEQAAWGRVPTCPDDSTAAYILETRKYFEDLRQVASQLAGLLVLAAAGSKSAGPHHPMLELAERLYEAAVEGVHHVGVTALARRHHQHLLEAASLLRTALTAAAAGLAIDPILQPLRAAYAQLELASHELPGFEMVAFEQGCCGVQR